MSEGRRISDQILSPDVLAEARDWALKHSPGLRWWQGAGGGTGAGTCPVLRDAVARSPPLLHWFMSLLEEGLEKKEWKDAWNQWHCSFC